MKLIHASKIEPIVFEALAEYIGKLQENKNVFEEILDNQNKEREHPAGAGCSLCDKSLKKDV